MPLTDAGMVQERPKERGSENGRGWRWGVWGVESKTQPTGNPSRQPPLHHPSGCTGRQPPSGTERQGKDWVANFMYINRTDSLVHSRTAQYRVELSLLFCHLCFPDDVTVEGLIMSACPFFGI